MNRSHSFRRTLGLYFSFALASISAIGLLISYAQLPHPPLVSYVSSLQLALLVGLYMSVGVGIINLQLTQTKSAQIVSSVVIFGLAILMGVQAVYPNYKTVAEAQVFTGTRKEAAQVGAALGEIVRQSELNLSEAQTVIAQKYANNAELQSLATNAFRESIKGAELSTPEIVSKTYPTIPLKLNAWSCVDIGCGYLDVNYVWTISRSEQLNGLGLLGLGLFLTWAVFGLEVFKVKFKD